MRPAQQTATRILDWLADGRRVVAEHGAIEGSITGGCVESAVAQEAIALLESGTPPRLVTYGISDELAGTVGLMCGGIVHVFVHELQGDAREAARLGLEALVDERPAAVATVLDGDQAGAKMFVDPSAASGSLGP